MRRDLELSDRFSGVPAVLRFTLDDETLALGGPDAAAVAELLRAAWVTGSVTIDPYPTSVAITDPFQDRAQLAAVLAERYALPDWLQAWALEGEEDADLDAGDAEEPPGLVY